MGLKRNAYVCDIIRKLENNKIEIDIKKLNKNTIKQKKLVSHS